MYILKKEKHYCHCANREQAQTLVNDGYEVVKTKIPGAKIVKQEPKKKMSSKKK